MFSSMATGVGAFKVEEWMSEPPMRKTGLGKASPPERRFLRSRILSFRI